MTDDDILLQEDEAGGHAGVRQLTLHRPERRNALSPALIDALIDALATADADDAVRALVITGHGPRAFCAGGDLSGGMLGDGFLGMHAVRGRFADLLRTFRRLKTPTVAAVRGLALGGGLGLVLACDLAVASDDAKLGTPEIKRGLFPMMIARSIYEHVPRKAANALVLLGETVRGARAVEYGLVNEVVPDVEVLARACALAGQLADLSPAVLGLGRRALARQSDLGFDAALSMLHDQLTLNLQLDDAAEGVSAFFEKRDPVWKGR